MIRAGRAARSVLVLAAVLLGAAGTIRAQTPTNLKVDGAPDNRHVLSFTPQFCWDFTGSQTNWHIQVDDDPDFTLNNHQVTPQVWFWDSGDQDKVGGNTARCAGLRSVNKAGSVPISLDRRAGTIYWRLRLKTSGGWGPWVARTLRMNQYPMMPADFSVDADSASSPDPVAAVPSKRAGKTYYVAPTGNDANAGTQSSPFKTIGKGARALAPGDTLFVRGGTYNENIEISPANGFASGEPNNPITVKAFPGESPVLRAVSSGNTTALKLRGPNLQISDWVFDGLKVGGSAATYGIFLDGVQSVTIRNCGFENTLTKNTIGLLVANGSEDVRITGCMFDQPVFDQLEIGAARHVEIRGNEFTRFDERHCIHAHGGQANNLIIADNYFHDGNPFEGTVFLYLGTQGSRVVNNVFANIQRVNPNNANDVGLAYGLLVVRGGEITVENNVFYNLENSAIQLNEFSSFGVYRNNIFMKNESGIRFRGGVAAGSSTAGAVMDYNLFYQNTTDISIPSGEMTFFAHPHTGNCLGGPPPSSSACDPRFVNAAGGDFRLASGSPGIDGGDPSSPVPEGGSARRDIGRFEAGAGVPPWHYQSQVTIGDSTPRFQWSINDVDNKLEMMFDDLPPGDTDYQTRFQLQIDPSPSFDSLSEGRPMIDSGIVTSQAEDYTVPDSRPLAPGEYYARVRQWDDHDFNKGAWSDHHFRFRVSGEPVPPYVSGQVPAAGAGGVLETTSITAHVRDDGVGVDTATIRMYVNGAQVTPAISGSPLDYTLIWTPPSPFPTEMVVTVRIVAQDLSQSPPGLDMTYSFTIRDTVPPQPPVNVTVQ